MTLKYADRDNYIKVIETWPKYFDEHLNDADHEGTEDQRSRRNDKLTNHHQPLDNILTLDWFCSDIMFTISKTIKEIFRSSQSYLIPLYTLDYIG